MAALKQMSNSQYQELGIPLGSRVKIMRALERAGDEGSVLVLEEKYASLKASVKVLAKLVKEEQTTREELCEFVQKLDL